VKRILREREAHAGVIQFDVQGLATGGMNASNVTITTKSSYVWPGANPDGARTGCTVHTNRSGCLVKVTVN
jgi:hypothetical protein